jgi:hypothetical protein
MLSDPWIPLTVSLFYALAYPAYKRVLEHKLSSQAFWRVWLLAPLLVIWAYSPSLITLLLLLLPSVPLLYVGVLKRGDLEKVGAVLLVEVVLALVETFLYYVKI